MKLPTLLTSLIYALSLGTPILAETPDQGQLTTLAEEHTQPSWSFFRELLSLPNDSNQPDHITTNVAFMERTFEERDFVVQRLETPTAPLLLAERLAEDASRTVLVYLQLDGQPVDPTRWEQDDPWQPVLKERTDDGWSEIPWERLHGEVDPEWRIFARASADAKGPVAMFLAALDAAVAAGFEPSYNLKVIMDFEEELGSPNLPAAVREHREALAADMLLIFDGPRHASNRPTLHFGARGIATVTLQVFGPRVPQHSGHYGNYAPNPALQLSQLLTSMKDAEGRVTLPGFYDGVVLDETTKSILARRRVVRPRGRG